MKPSELKWNHKHDRQTIECNSFELCCKFSVMIRLKMRARGTLADYTGTHGQCSECDIVIRVTWYIAVIFQQSVFATFFFISWISMAILVGSCSAKRATKIQRTGRIGIKQFLFRYTTCPFFRYAKLCAKNRSRRLIAAANIFNSKRLVSMYDVHSQLGIVYKFHFVFYFGCFGCCHCPHRRRHRSCCWHCCSVSINDIRTWIFACNLFK